MPTTSTQKPLMIFMLVCFLPVISLLFMSIITRSENVANAAPAHEWEYMRVIRGKDIQQDTLGRGTDGRNVIIGNWTTTFIGSKSVKIEDGIEPVLNQLGSQGWELVTVFVLAGDSGGPLSASGMTTAQVWVFKRPR